MLTLFQRIVDAFCQFNAETLNPDNPEGWVPVILPNDKRGYVSTKYAYHLLGYRAIFEKQQGKWMKQAFLAGD